MTPSKRYLEKAKRVDPGQGYAIEEALKLIKETASAKFDETVDLAVKLGVDLKKGEATVRGTVLLPAGSGKSTKILVLAKGEKIKEAEGAGADLVGSEELIEKISQGFLDFDVILATPDMMGAVGKLGKILGPKGLMPSPKSGTVTFEIEKAVKEFKSGKLEFKADKGGVVHLPLGKASFEAEKLKENFLAALEAIYKAKPSAFKGIYLKSIALSATMGPGIRIQPQKILDEMGEDKN